MNVVYVEVMSLECLYLRTDAFIPTLSLIQAIWKYSSYSVKNNPLQ